MDAYESFNSSSEGVDIYPSPFAPTIEYGGFFFFCEYKALFPKLSFSSLNSATTVIREAYFPSLLHASPAVFIPGMYIPR